MAPDGEVIDDALLAADLAPSDGSLRARDPLVVRDEETGSAVADASPGHRPMREAPAIIACCASLHMVVRHGSRRRKPYCIQDVSASVEGAAVNRRPGPWCPLDRGLQREEVSVIMSLPWCVRPMTFMPLGRPIEDGPRHQGSMIEAAFTPSAGDPHRSLR